MINVSDNGYVTYFHNISVYMYVYKSKQKLRRQRNFALLNDNSGFSENSQMKEIKKIHFIYEPYL